MWESSAGQQWPIGVEIGTDHLRMAQIQQRRGSTRLVVESREAPPHLNEGEPGYERAVSDLLAGMLKKPAGFRGRRVVSGLPNHRLLCRMLRLAPMPPDELAKAAHWKMAAELGVKADGFQSSVLNLGTTTVGDKARIEVACIGADNQSLKQHTAILTAAGLKPVAIDASTCAAVRCIGRLQETEAFPPQVLVLELTPACAMLAVAEGSKLSFVRALGEGLVRSHQLVANMLGVTLAQSARLHDDPWVETVAAVTPRGETSASVEVTPARVRDAVVDAASMYARDLARQITLSLHHLSEALGRSIPAAGVLVGPCTLPPEALAALSAQTRISFVPAARLPEAAWERDLHDAEAGANPQSWLTAVGLSLYREPDPLSREAA